MANEELSGVYDTTAPVLMFQPNLFTPKAFKGPNGKPNGEPKFSANFGLQPTGADLAGMKEIAKALAKAKWPGRSLKELVFPFKNGDELADKAKAKVDAKVAKARLADYYRGLVILPARSLFAPRMAAIVNGKLVDFDEVTILQNKNRFFFGGEVYAQVAFKAYEGVGANPDGINAYLNQILATGKGTRIGGSSVAENFRRYVGTMSAEDPTQAGGGDDIDI